MSYAKMALLAIGLLIAGVLAAEAPAVVQDFRFLRAVRVFNEQQQAAQALQQQQQQQQQQATRSAVPTPKGS